MEAVGLVGAEETAALLRAAFSGDIPQALSIFDKLYFGGREPASILEETATLCRDILLQQVAGPKAETLQSGRFAANVIAAFAKSAPSARLMQQMSLIQTALADMSRSHDRRMTAELCLLRLCDPALAPDPQALTARVAALEQQLRTGVQIPVPQSEPQPEAAKTPAQQPEPQPAAAKAPVQQPEPQPAAAKTPAQQPEPQPAAAKAPVQQPETQPAAAKTPAPAADMDVDTLWAAVLDRCVQTGAMDAMKKAVLAGREHVVPSLTGSTLLIGTKNDFARQLADQTAVTTAIKQAAEAIAGHTLTVRVAPYTAQQTPVEDKLDALSRFSNITFK